MQEQDRFDLQRFVDAQNAIYAQVRRELANGEKQSHWMWFIFPQGRGLGSSAMSRRYAISGPEEARAYLAHPLLGARLRECTLLVRAVVGRSLQEIFGFPDDLKFCSSMTLFAAVDGDDRGQFQAALEALCSGQRDPATLALLLAREPEK